MKCSPKCRTKKLGMIYTNLGSFCSFLNWEGPDILPQIRPRKVLGTVHCTSGYNFKKNIVFFCLKVFS